MDTWRLRLGDCVELLRELPENSVDSIVTDPPAGIAFMGREFDTFKSRAHFISFMTAVMRECLRVLRPGGHALVWALPRTSHWTATAIEDAGFEIRDDVTVLLHCFGTGFPKGRRILELDIVPEIERALRAQGVEGEIKWRP